MDHTYKINDLRTISETLEEETIIINLENGNYYSMNSTGTIIWDKIQANYSIRQIIRYLTNRYNESFVTIEKSVVELIEFLKNDNLILEAEHHETDKEDYSGFTVEKFVSPLIERFEDMQEMLLADPIHDVREDGWPNVKRERVNE